MWLLTFALLFSDGKGFILVTTPNLFSLIAILISSFNGKKARSHLKYLARNYLVDKES